MRNSLLTAGACALAMQIACLTPAMAADPAPAANVFDLNDITQHPDKYQWFDFRPSLKKLILAGAADASHISILWYPAAKGSVALHYHAKTESVYVIDGSQADGKGSYNTGTVYFNPPGSGHAVKDSAGFFVLSYAAPPDFAKTALIGEYTPVKVDTASADFERSALFHDKAPGLRVADLGLDPKGGMQSQFMHLSSGHTKYSGSYVMVVKGSCSIDGAAYNKGVVLVTKTGAPQSFDLGVGAGGNCMALGMSF
jgi:hypothetical protein